MATTVKLKKAYNLQETFASEKKLLTVWGLYPTYDAKGFYKLFFYIRSIIAFTVVNLFALSMWVNVPMNMENPSVVIETLYYALVQVTFMGKLYNIHIRKYKYLKLLAYLDTAEFNNYSEEQFIYIEDATYLPTIFSKMFRASVSIALVFYIWYPYVENTLPLPSYFPLDWDEKYRYFCFAFQTMGMTTNGYCQSSFDILMAKLISLGSAQFEILKDNLRNFRRGLDNSIENKAENDEICKQRLKKYIKHHIILINLAYDLEDFFSLVLFIQFLISSVIICVTGYQILVTPFTDVKFVALLIYLSGNLIELAVTCWFGQDILTKSETVGDACYMSDWYNSGISVCRILFIIMERAKRPIKLTAGKFFELTLQTLMQVLKTSYSYLTLLRRMNEVK